ELHDRDLVFGLPAAPEGVRVRYPEHQLHHLLCVILSSGGWCGLDEEDGVDDAQAVGEVRELAADQTQRSHDAPHGLGRHPAHRRPQLLPLRRESSLLHFSLSCRLVERTLLYRPALRTTQEDLPRSLKGFFFSNYFP